jgi:hypothetical protein
MISYQLLFFIDLYRLRRQRVGRVGFWMEKSQAAEIVNRDTIRKSSYSLSRNLSPTAAGYRAAYRGFRFRYFIFMSVYPL